MSTEKRLVKARECFEVNSSMYITAGEPTSEESERYNLYMGLWHLTDALLEMQQDIEIIKDDVRRIKDSQ
jgi:hypothetical protein